MKLRAWILRSLGTGAILLVVLIVSGSLWGVLSALGDDSGAEVMQGVSLVALVCWILNFVTLVVLLAVALLSSNERPDPDEEK